MGARHRQATSNWRAQPFAFGPIATSDRARAGVLLQHGFTGTPFEMRWLGETLAERHPGLSVLGPRLPGHGEDAPSLAERTFRDWAREHESGFDALAARCERVAICGLSMGGLLALELSSRRGREVAALVSLAAPLHLSRSVERGIRALMRTPLGRTTIPRLGGSDIRDPRAKADNLRATGRVGFPVAAVASLMDLQVEVRARLSSVTSPLLLVHARHDHTAPFASMAEIASRVSSNHVETIELAESFHVVTLDLERERVLAAIEAHLARHLAW